MIYNKDTGQEVFRNDGDTDQLEKRTWDSGWQQWKSKPYMLMPNFDESGTHQLFVRPIDENGNGGFWGTPIEFGTSRSESGYFEFPSQPPAVQGPSGIIGDNTPLVRSETVDHAHHYEIQIYDTVQGKMIGQHGIYENSITLNELKNGSYQVFVRAIGPSADTGNWSSPLEFSIDLKNGVNNSEKPTILSHQYGIALGGENFEWSSESDESEYELIIYDIAAGKEVLHKTGIESASYELWNHLHNGASEPLPTGTKLQFFVRRTNSDGLQGPWSDPVESILIT